MRKSPEPQQITVLFSWSLPLCYKNEEKAPHSKAFSDLILSDNTNF
jgi:hypothetical protein